MLKECFHCKESKSIDEFTRHSKSKDGKHHLCRNCKSAYQKQLRNTNPERYSYYRRTVNLENKKNYIFRYKHQFEREEAVKILQEQGGCKICKKDLLAEDSQWYVDHDHNCCGQNKSCKECRRGILCRECNLMLGFAKDNKDVLRMAIDYLANYEREKMNGNSK